MARRVLFLGAIGVLLVLSTLGVVLESRRTAAANGSDQGTFTVAGISRRQLDEAYQQSQTLVRQPKGTVRAGILPHHLLVAPLFAAFFSGLPEQSAPSTVVVIGPDHGNIGRGYVSTTRHSWQTPDGIVVKTNTDIVDALVRDDTAVVDDHLLEVEHGVYAALPFVKRQFPNALVVQLALRGDLRPDRLEALARRLNELLGPHDLVLASVDLSHYKTAAGAWSDDAVTLSAIRNGDPDDALRIPVDSPPAISLLLRFARMNGLTLQELAHTNSAEFLHDLRIASTTSYLTAYFYR